MTVPLHAHRSGATAPDRQARALALLIRLSVHVVVVLVPGLAAAAFGATLGPVRDPLPVIGALSFAGFAVSAIRLGTWSLGSLREGRRPARLDRARIAACAGAVVALSVIAVALHGAGATPLVTLAAAAALGALAPALPAASAAVGVAAIVTVSTAVLLVTAVDPLRALVAAALPTALSAVLLVAATWCSGLLLRMVHELDAARRVAALAAVAEDRLRIARDLHDVFGRTLVVVGLKSELAAELAARTGADRAAAEMREVHRIVESTGAEMRRVLHGTRQPQLAVEIEGARGLLDAAGVRFVLDGDPSAVPESARHAFAWTLREAVTNALRHADARRFEIRIREGETVSMELRNDGVRAGTGGTGTGLSGIRAPRGRGGRAGERAPRGRRVRDPRRGAAMIRLLLADDETLIRDAVGALLDLEADIEVVARCSDGGEAVARAVELSPAVALLDLQMPVLDGIEVTRRLRIESPACRCLLLTSHGRPGYLKTALAAGARGFLPKTTSASRLAEAVRIVADGGRFVDPELAAVAMAAGDSPLTAREADVLALAADARPIADIAARAALSPGTVRNYLSNAILKLGAANRHDAVRAARERGWI